MTENKEKLKSLLSQYFTYYKYKEAIEKIKELFKNKQITTEQWNGIKSIILKRELKRGEPLSLLATNANLPLDEDTDEEAYKWLDLFIKNIESSDDIVEY